MGDTERADGRARLIKAPTAQGAQRRSCRRPIKSPPQFPVPVPLRCVLGGPLAPPRPHHPSLLPWAATTATATSLLCLSSLFVISSFIRRLNRCPLQYR